MDGAVKRVDKIAKRILPDQPHHLSVSTSRRFPIPSGFWFDGFSSRLQYMTYLSDADRGVLLTRPSYEIRDDPEAKNIHNSSDANHQTEPKKPVTKMSFKDYQNRKKSPQSPSENDVPPKLDARHVNAPEAAWKREEPGWEDQKANGPGRAQGTKRDRPVPELNGDRCGSSYYMSDSKPATSPSSESRKRTAELDDQSQPQKRAKADNHVSKHDSGRMPHLPTPHQKEPSNRDAGLAKKDPKIAAAHSRLNGRGHLEIEKVKRASPSPKPVIRVNGTTVHSAGGASPLSQMLEDSSKPAVPPLLSPLRLSLDEDSEVKSSSRKWSAESRSDQNGPRKQQTLEDSPPPRKKKSPLHIPPLLSPTLPPAVESELARMRRTPSKGDSSRQSSQASESPSSAKKAKAPTEGRGDGDRPRAASLIVTLKYKKRNVLRVQRLLALPPSQKDVLKKERSVSAEVTPPPTARKRPLAAEEHPQPSPKQSKSVAEIPVPIKPTRPSTPQKHHAQAMSRMASANSQAETPRDTTGLTPGVVERPPTSSDSNEHGHAARVLTLRKRHEDYSRLGVRLKHSRDDIVRARSKSDGASAPTLSSADEKKVAALTLEMIMAYMVGFRAHNQGRSLEKKLANYNVWEDLVPHLVEVRHRTRHARVLYTIALQLHAICLEELNQCYMAYEPPNVAARMWKNSKKLRDIWVEAHERAAAISDDAMKAHLGPWSSADSAVAAALRVVKRWAELEKVDWRPEITVPAINGA